MQWTATVALSHPAAMDTDTNTIVSRHTTSEGVVVWSRCAVCGRLQMALVPYGVDGKGLAAGGHDIRCPHCGR
jgi:DNA-directed RNA polymerase subunit RPC12/RpoP